jgi:dienelactone hydrolase
VPDAVDAGRTTTVPLLVVTSAADRGIPADELAAAVAASPAQHKRFLKLPGRSHGWDLTMESIAADAAVTPTGRLVLDWARTAGTR